MTSRAPLRSMLALVALVAASALGVGLTSRSAAQSTAPGDRPRCVEVTSVARFDGSGYSHWVTVTNRCDEALQCVVTTDVAPAPVAMRLSAGQSREVNTFLSSPARAFTPTVACSR